MFMIFMEYFWWLKNNKKKKDSTYVHEILCKNSNNILIIESLRAIIESKKTIKSKFFLNYYNQKIPCNLFIKDNKLILNFINPLMVNTLQIKSFIFYLGYINKNNYKKYHLPMYLESIEYTFNQEGDFSYYGEVLQLLNVIIPEINNMNNVKFNV